MTLEQIKIDLQAKLAAMSKEERIAGLEKAGFIFADPWLETLLESSQAIPVVTTTPNFGAAANDLGLAA